MKGYKDMTFCQFYDSCSLSDDCGRALTPAVQRDAEETQLPIFMFVAPPICHSHWKDRQDIHKGKEDLDA